MAASFFTAFQRGSTKTGTSWGKIMSHGQPLGTHAEAFNRHTI